MEKEFELNTFTGQKVYEINIGIRAESSKHQTTTYHRDGIFIEEHKIIFQTPYRIALDNDYIETITRLKKDGKVETYNSYLEKCNVSIITKEDYFPNGIFGRVLTIGKVEKGIAKLKKKIAQEVREKYGFLAMDIEGILANYNYKK